MDGPESALVFSTPQRAVELSRAVSSGRARRLARGVYTFDLSTPPEGLTRQNWLALTAHFLPEAVIVDRSVQSGGPDREGHLFVVHRRPRVVRLPGLTIVARTGSGPLEDDLPLPLGLWMSSVPRALVENLRPSRAVKGRPRRTLSEKELHDWVAKLLRSEGRERLNRMRDRAREIATVLLQPDATARIDAVVGAALGTREVSTESPSLAAAQRGLAYDERRDALFSTLARALASRAPAPRPAPEHTRTSMANLAFFEAYFSNFIEGTEFTVEEAARIVFGGEIPAERPADAHDVLGTYAVVGDPEEMKRVPRHVDELLALLRARHARVMQGRPEKRPGQLKERANRAGSTEFVAPGLVVGTLARAAFHLEALEDPFARAVFMMFAVSEVHPFDDGNGRVARIMMNAELHGAGEQRILIPTVYRNEYLAGLRAVTHNARTDALIRVLDFAHRYTAQIAFTTFEGARQLLASTHAFVSPEEAERRGIRLTLPTALPR